MINILMPMAGKGSRFEQVGYDVPKPFIPIDGVPMFLFSASTIDFEARYIYVIRKEHLDYFSGHILDSIAHLNYELVVQSGDSNGSVVSCLLADKYINNNDPLVIMDCDQRNSWNPAKTMQYLKDGEFDGAIITFESTNPSYSYVLKDSQNFIKKTAEKEVISTYAAGGVYVWSSGSDFIKYSTRMIDKGLTINNEFYVCPTYNEAILDGLKFTTINTDRIDSVGTPEALQQYLSSAEN